MPPWPNIIRLQQEQQHTQYETKYIFQSSDEIQCILVVSHSPTLDMIAINTEAEKKEKEKKTLALWETACGWTLIYIYLHPEDQLLPLFQVTHKIQC